MKKHTVCALLLLGLGAAACQKPEEVVPPARLIPRDQLVRLLIDLHTLEAQVDASALPPDSGRALFRVQQQQLYRRLNVTDSAFQQSYRYYAIHDKDLDEIYAIVIDSLALRESRRQTPGTPPPHR
ncbi:DUF4296 domain-containing protein [Hymenobacter weizhouensis]|uniref:DUF4296 domain-containing protein n=1 Tax=Hymenobacter sp. YIM 151500-1 TaxID=2987689 RepID=UPI002226290E|nr:DUF4296 domain-containing protein [Hymenobacter sp. YIM 151500-1]UYZ63596.1 DUF4296 domain-containing protein [Hymenobacter sp. YIM 151500-1]